VAISPNNNDVHIYKKTGATWEVIHELKEVRPFQDTEVRQVGMGLWLVFVVAWI
jgi:hypothetical protein